MMLETDLDLRKLLAPIGEDTFFRTHWEKEPLHIVRDERDYYSGLFSSNDVDSIIAFTRPKFADASAFTPEVPRQKSFVQGWLADRPMEETASYPGIGELR